MLLSSIDSQALSIEIREGLQHMGLDDTIISRAMETSSKFEPSHWVISLAVTVGVRKDRKSHHECVEILAQHSYRSPDTEFKPT